MSVSQLLASAFSSSLNSTVITHAQYEREKEGYFAALNINQLFDISRVTGVVGDEHPELPVSESLFNIYVRTLTGKTVTQQTASHHFIVDVKEMLQEKDCYPVDQQRLTFDGKMLHDRDGLYDYGIQAHTTIHMILRLCGGGSPTYYIDDSLLDSAFDCDFTRKQDDAGTQFFRGERRYYRPYGWQRFALKVLGRYEDDSWLGRPGFRTNSTPGEWAVSYHGTAVGASGSIAQEGYDLSRGKRFLYGRGVYTAPSVEVAAKYAQRFAHEGDKYQLVFQNRVSVEDLRVVDSPFGEYWVQPNEHFIRPYGICLRRL